VSFFDPVESANGELIFTGEERATGDVGGLDFGPIEPEKNGTAFHAGSDWERRTFAMALASSVVDNFDEARRHRERMQPQHQLDAPYYESWLYFLEQLALEKGLVTLEELATGIVADEGGEPRIPAGPDQALEVVRRGTPYNRNSGRLTPRFQRGDTVRVSPLRPHPGHTRVPRYVRGKRGGIERHHGTFVFPDTVAVGQGEHPQPLYTVRFEARELWGPEAVARDSVYIELFEDYLEPG
jgi:nitrile hydratase